ncbi:hypothetical protein [Spongiimicrobium salis]|uniref:hypothetical protein n=1 Tax=Spongiimicrobium salis TaxID=1667022 RepID=UPI00374D9887
MRKINLVLIVVVLLSTLNTFAKVSETKNPVEGKDLTAQIGELLEDNAFTIEEVDLTAKVKFILNDENEIVVLSVATENASFEAFVKSRLNYQKVEGADVEGGKTYTIPVRITE